MAGIDLGNIATQAAPVITEQINKALEDIPVTEGESKGLVIVSDSKGQYIIVKTVFDKDASAHMTNRGYENVDNLINNTLSAILK